MTDAPPTFGRRGLPLPTRETSAVARSEPPRASPAEAVGSRPDDGLRVPHSPRGLALAAFGVTAFEFFVMSARTPRGGLADAALNTDLGGALAHPGALFALVPFAFILCLGGLQVAAIYLLIAHPTLRWIGLKSLIAYAIGGVCAAYLLLAARTFAGVHVQFGPALIELVGGAIAGASYRCGAGLVATSDPERA